MHFLKHLGRYRLSAWIKPGAFQKLNAPNKGMASRTESLIALAHAAALAAAEHQQRFAAEDMEARKIVEILERFLRLTGRVVYGGAAINAHMPTEHKFYDPALNLPDYDFMTPDPLQDCADLLSIFIDEGFTDVEAKFGIHEGTYKIFVNYRPAADITFIPSDVYERLTTDADIIDGILFASVNFLRMNIYLELSRPAGMVSRWEKVYERLLLLNRFHPLRPGHCTAHPLEALGASKGRKSVDAKRLISLGVEAGAIFLSGASMLVGTEPSPNEIVLLMSEHASALANICAHECGLTPTVFDALGELLPARTELRLDDELRAVVFQTVACHNFVELKDGYRLGSLDLLIQMYYAMYFANLQEYVSVRLLCVIHELIELEAARRLEAAETGDVIDVFPLECAGHQPSIPELKKAHRERIIEKRGEFAAAIQPASGFRVTRRHHHESTRKTRKVLKN